MQVHKWIQVINEEMSNQRGWSCIKEITCRVKKPKASGYQSLHLILKVPVGEQMVKVETQIRTQAMDFWSDIEHHFVYKTNNLNIEECEEEFLKCSKSIRKIDKQMLKIRRKIENTQ